MSDAALTPEQVQTAAEHLATAFERFIDARLSDDQAHAHRIRLIGHLEAAEKANADARTEVVAAHLAVMREAIDEFIRQSILARGADAAIAKALRDMAASFDTVRAPGGVLQ